jgi:Ca-activated chloride channel family protein
MTTTTAHRIPFFEQPSKKQSRMLGVLEALGPARISLPLAGVELRARVAGRVAEVQVAQKFQNTLIEPLEAVYIFPLSGGCAVSKFEMQIGARVLQGKVEERGEARRQYAVALEEGKRAALLEQERDDVITVQVGNLMPGEEVTVRLTYSERLSFFEDGRTELRLPLVVAPRYASGTPLEREQAGLGVAEDSTTVPDASRITPPRLAEGFDPKTSLSIECQLEGGFSDLACSQHATSISTGGKGALVVTLSREDEPLNRDFVLRWKIAGEQVKTSLVAHDGYALLSLLPPARDGFLGTARDVVFVVDRSGSMEGVKMASAARACALLLRTLAPRDRFAIQAFDNSAEWMPGPRFVEADEGGIEAGERFLRGIEARGGTELDMAMQEAISAVAQAGEAAGRVPVIVLLTDGQVGDESSVLRRIQSQLGEARVFTIGIDTAVNSGFLKRLAALGGGTATLVEPGAQLETALRSIGREIGTPLITDLTIDGDALEPGSLAPAQLQDLFAGRATSAFLRLRKPGSLRLRGTFSDGEKFEETVSVSEVPGLNALGHLWARARVSDLEDRFRLEPGQQAKLRAEIVALAVQHTLLTRFTAFVVVDGEVVNRDGARRQVVQPVEMPAQWASAGAPKGAFGGGHGLPPPSPVMASAPRPPPPPSVMRESQDESAAASMPAPARRAKLASPLAAPAANRAPGLLNRLMGKKEMRDEDGSQAEGASSEERAKLTAALEALVTAMTFARQQLAAGKVPDHTPLTKARKDLLAALKGSALAMQLPALQRFLRQGAVELLAALQAKGTSLAALAQLFEQHARSLEAARDEARGPLQGQAKPGAFWESSI